MFGKQPGVLGPRYPDDMFATDDYVLRARIMFMCATARATTMCRCACAPMQMSPDVDSRWVCFSGSVPWWFDGQPSGTEFIGRGHKQRVGIALGGRSLMQPCVKRPQLLVSWSGEVNNLLAAQPVESAISASGPGKTGQASELAQRQNGASRMRIQATWNCIEWQVRVCRGKKPRCSECEELRTGERPPDTKTDV